MNAAGVGESIVVGDFSRMGCLASASNSINFLRGLVRHFSYCGALKKNWTIFLNGIAFFFLFLLNTRRNGLHKSELYSDFDEYVHKFSQDSNFKNLNFLLNLLYLRHSAGFKVVCVEVDKKYRKKLQTRYVMKLTYLTQYARRKHFFRIFNSFVLNTKIRGAESRICDVMCNGVLSGNKSLFFNYKKMVFKYLLQKK